MAVIGRPRTPLLIPAVAVEVSSKWRTGVAKKWNAGESFASVTITLAEHDVENEVGPFCDGVDRSRTFNNSVNVRLLVFS